jgi:predicted transcriptional regulator
VEREVYLEEVAAQAEARRSPAQDLRDKGLSYREIAMKMGVSIASINSYLKIQ